MTTSSSSSPAVIASASTRFHGKAVIVTGAARGIGCAIARRFVAEGAMVVLADRNKELVSAAAASLTGPGHGLALDVDISTEIGAARAVAFALERFGRLDIVVSNAAIYPFSLVHDISVEEWDEVLGVNLRGAFLIARAALEPLKQSGSGRIIYMSSITGPRVSSPGHAHYSASKAGINGLIKTVALEFAGHGITVNAIEPGNIMTEGLAAERSEAFISSMCDSIPLGRLGSTEEVASAVAFLASDEAAYITGTSIIVDGGQTLPESLSFRV
ncbi:MAG TPA: SDR family NAD(P)-dependent oxidoreductase [Devosia sp.]|nr:SDR family NAD(P)-dependent oxidoreductase [Devosia sp.]